MRKSSDVLRIMSTATGGATDRIAGATCCDGNENDSKGERARAALWAAGGGDGDTNGLHRPLDGARGQHDRSSDSDGHAISGRRDTQVPLGATYTLGRLETLHCIRIGRERQAKNAHGGTHNCNYSGRNDDDIHITGVFGEFAFRRLFGLPLHELEDTTCRNVLTDVRLDAVLANGWKVDVKTCTVPNAPLTVPARKASNPPHVYALMTYLNPRPCHERITESIDSPCIEFRGFALARTVFAEGTEMRRQRTTVYTLPQSRLATLDRIRGSAHHHHTHTHNDDHYDAQPPHTEPRPDGGGGPQHPSCSYHYCYSFFPSPDAPRRVHLA